MRHCSAGPATLRTRLSYWISTRGESGTAFCACRSRRASESRKKRIGLSERSYCGVQLLPAKELTMALGSAHWKQRHPQPRHESFPEDCHRKVADSDQESGRSMNDEKEATLALHAIVSAGTPACAGVNIEPGFWAGAAGVDSGHP